MPCHCIAATRQCFGQCRFSAYYKVHINMCGLETTVLCFLATLVCSLCLAKPTQKATLCTRKQTDFSAGLTRSVLSRAVRLQIIAKDREQHSFCLAATPGCPLFGKADAESNPMHKKSKLLLSESLSAWQSRRFRRVSQPNYPKYSNC